MTDHSFRIKFWTVCYRNSSDGNFKLQIPPESASVASGLVYTSRWAEWTSGWTKLNIFYITPATGVLYIDNIIEYKQ